MIQMTAAVDTESISGLKATSTLSPMPTKQNVSTFECSFRRTKLMMVPMMAQVHTNTNSAQPQLSEK